MKSKLKRKREAERKAAELEPELKRSQLPCVRCRINARWIKSKILCYWCKNGIDERAELARLLADVSQRKPQKLTRRQRWLNS